MKKKIIILIIVIFVLILGVGGFFYLWQGQMAQKSKEIEKKEEVTEEKIIETFGDIVVKETPEGKIVENKKEGISMKVPEGWEVNTHTSEDVVLEIRKFGPNQTLDTELQDGMILSVYINDNPQGLNIEGWIAKRETELPEEIQKSQEEGVETEIIDLNGELTYEEIGDKKVGKTINKVVSGTDEYDRPVFLENSEEISMSFVSATLNNRVLTLGCISVGPDYQNYSRECEEVMKNKIQREF